MIPQRYLEEWKTQAPWPANAQVEQDLIITRALVEIFSDDLLKNALAFRGGTALHKLYLQPQARYSEDIDLVQINSEPINPILKQIRERLSFLGTKRTVKQHIHNNTIIYRFDTSTQPIINMRLKIEINTREHFHVLGLKQIPYIVENGWFSAECMLTGYELEELLGTKLRALYQRRKGRDLFDLYWALRNQQVDIEKLIHCYKTYMQSSVDKPPTQKQFLINMAEKMTDHEFLDDIHIILKPGIEYTNEDAWEVVRREIIEKI
ncbi:MAG: nucleotidyltransferase [Bacteroidetes bacterium GWE2_39_28]|nr:MAG: nucleotidyltransferase [Bacteroidetes bacterium GWE2_39_28]OFY15265.1 MAG: nucleotidyltransferase [Bacteroidetes bacterium GWF2_39_10]OFZ08717.1 MAG: nucleotidyltransferase [Bacteroidetes bacterium RIFOXYB2_FULL_39_7]OFZ11113.1 MAG: nucleotidyltransferase [Bacteroidetes bacterium RIFOXYC2_FULL_39_11]HCT93898.1 nucleotidyl transferase AbiEii/AbiGii toxin family protein [Rikenellaceae bacterium]